MNALGEMRQDAISGNSRLSLDMTAVEPVA
jgi:hypothetical protein